MLTTRSGAYISRFGDFCVHDNDDTTDHSTPAHARGVNYSDPVATINQICKSPNLKFFFFPRTSFGLTTKFNSCQYFLLYSMYMFGMVNQTQNGVLSLEQLRWPSSHPGGWGILCSYVHRL